MLKKMQTTNPNVIGMTVEGQLSADDYEKTLIPLFEQAKAKGEKLRLLFYMGPKYEGFTPAAAWEDFQFGMRYFSTFKRCAIVCDVDWIRSMTRVFGSMMPCPVKAFEVNELQQAEDWLTKDSTGIDLLFDRDRQVIKVEIHGPLASDDFDYLSHQVDNWLEMNGQLKGLVIHSHEFPGWTNLGAFMSHLSFIKNYHRRLRKVALCVDGKLPELAPQLAKHFVEADIQHFDYNHLEQAMNWAADV